MPTALVDMMKKEGFAGPTTIQSAVWPALMQVQDLIGIAKTGSGKVGGACARRAAVGVVGSGPVLLQGSRSNVVVITCRVVHHGVTYSLFSVVHLNSQGADVVVVCGSSDKSFHPFPLCVPYRACEVAEYDVGRFSFLSILKNSFLPRPWRFCSRPTFRSMWRSCTKRMTPARCLPKRPRSCCASLRPASFACRRRRSLSGSGIR